MNLAIIRTHGTDTDQVQALLPSVYCLVSVAYRRMYDVYTHCSTSREVIRGACLRPHECAHVSTDVLSVRSVSRFVREQQHGRWRFPNPISDSKLPSLSPSASEPGCSYALPPYLSPTCLLCNSLSPWGRPFAEVHSCGRGESRPRAGAAVRGDV